MSAGYDINDRSSTPIPHTISAVSVHSEPDHPEPPRSLVRMCGIAGFAGSDPELLDRMLRSIVHRGPDGAGTDVGPHFSIGMRRLAIVQGPVT